MAEEIKKRLENNRTTEELHVIDRNFNVVGKRPNGETFKNMVGRPEPIISEYLVGDKKQPVKRDIIARTQSTSDASKASDNKDN